jgi:hypothetical protein
VFSECRKCYFRDPNVKITTARVPAVLGWARKMGPLVILPHHSEESLKNALDYGSAICILNAISILCIQYENSMDIPWI